MYAYGRYEYDYAIKDWNKNTMYHNVLCSRNVDENVDEEKDEVEEEEMD